jgi:RNA polymerase sigma-70 factor (ECF subfamily)
MPPQKPNILSTYLGKITRQISIDIFRKRTTQKRRGSEYAISLSELEDCIASNDNPEKEFEVKLLAEKINDYLHSLPTEARNVFIGRYYFMDSIKEVAAYYGMSESKVKSILYRARLGLKKYLEEAGYTL